MVPNQKCGVKKPGIMFSGLSGLGGFIPSVAPFITFHGLSNLLCSVIPSSCVSWFLLLGILFFFFFSNLPFESTYSSFKTLG